MHHDKTKRQTDKKKSTLSYFSGQPAVAGDQTSSQEKLSLKLGWPEWHSRSEGIQLCHKSS